MEISIQDIGVVHQADIKLEGLTVIAGENGVGKSAVGKALYCALQSGYKMEEKYSEDYKTAVMHKMTNTLLEVLPENPSVISNMIGIFLNELNKPEFNLQERLSTLFGEDPDLYNALEKHFEDENYIDIPKPSITYGEIKQREHDKLIASIFQGSYNNKLSSTSSSCRVQINEKVQNTVVMNNRTKDYESSTALLKQDIILLETPIILSIYRYIKENLAFNNNQNKLLPYYMQDLIKKISESSYNPDYTQPLCKAIQDIIKGQILIENDQLFYQDQKENKHPIQSVATGIKSLGMLQLLVAGGAIKEDTILIIDEPEVHLHPSWQLAYAKIIVELVKEDINVLITSHSSTFIEALKVYSENEGVSQKTNFYLGKMTPKGSVFEEVTESLEPIYKAFAAPSLELMLEKSKGKYQKQASASVAQEKQAPYSKKDKQDS